jgi:ribosomal protein S12 methylthiotransferase
LRGDLVSRPIGNGDGAKRKTLVKCRGAKRLLVISQDTSAYGVDIKYKLDFWNGQPLKSKFYELCEALGQLGVWVRLHYVYPIRMSMQRLI